MSNKEKVGIDDLIFARLPSGRRIATTLRKYRASERLPLPTDIAGLRNYLAEVGEELALAVVAAKCLDRFNHLSFSRVGQVDLSYAPALYGAISAVLKTRRDIGAMETPEQKLAALILLFDYLHRPNTPGAGELQYKQEQRHALGLVASGAGIIDWAGKPDSALDAAELFGLEIGEPAKKIAAA